MDDLAAVPSDAVRERLAEEPNVWLCTVRPNGSPHVTPVWFVYGHESSRWWIGSDLGAVKVRNVLADPRVSLALEDGRHPVVAEGDATVLRGGFPPDVVDAFRRKYGWDVTVPERPGGSRVLLEVRVRRWLLAGTAQ
ncbi:pyridoxamine 5'-phosphate oxidase family protein [Streptomyces sp. NPDC050504]|uniref:pyridoxamine 5'-phosphate oxidase family protein n=1 Tax=Streptomyces sp. NPDC050504 TaxID=3365618 RepID=UPI0037BB3E91